MGKGEEKKKKGKRERARRREMHGSSLLDFDLHPPIGVKI